MGWHPQVIHTLLFHTKGGTYASLKIKHLSGLFILLHLFPSFVSGLIPHAQNTVLAHSLQTTSHNNLLLVELCLFLLAAKAGPIPRAAHVICTLDLYNISLITTPGPSVCSQYALETWEGRDDLVLGCWTELGHKLHVILGKHFIPCFVICSRATK